MKEITLEITSNQQLWKLFDKRVDNIFIHKFKPHEVIEWWTIDLKIKDDFVLRNVSVREMEFDLQTDLKGLKQILELNIRQLRVYQFEKLVPHTMILEQMPEKFKKQILRHNGLRHFFWIDFEFINISSFDEDFIKSIEENPIFIDQIIRRE